MKKVFFLLAFFATITAMSAQEASLEVVKGDTSAIVVQNGERHPITSLQLEADYSKALAAIQELEERRNRLAQLVKMDEELEKAKALQETRRQLYPKVKAIEAEIQAGKVNK